MREFIGVVSKLYNLSSNLSGYMERTFLIDLHQGDEDFGEEVLVCRYGTKNFEIINSIQVGIPVRVIGTIEVRSYKVDRRLACGPIVEIETLIIKL